MRAHQMTYGMMMGDAVSQHVLAIDERLRAWGYDSAIYAQHVAPEMQARVQPDGRFARYLSAPDDLLIYHYSIYTPNTRLFRAAQGRKILIYHNITPASFFAGWDDKQAALCQSGRQALPLLAACDLALADSEFNRQELLAAGFAAEKTAVLPIFLPAGFFDTQSPPPAPPQANWLTVGRVAPNKALEEVIRIFAVYCRALNPQARLTIVGSRYLRGYAQALDDLVAALDLGERVTFAGRVSDAELRAAYETADLYVTASRHEGFCVPLLESMAYGVPVLAYKATAVPQTLGPAGVLFTRFDYGEIAKVAHLMLTDAALRAQIVATQRARLHDFHPRQTARTLQAIFARLGLPHGADGAL